jgi:TolB-like protein
VRLISELKRRNVFRMAVLYVLAAWLVMQVAEVVIGLANLPEWIGPALLAVLALGFPIALVISWFYEITPEGLALEKDVPEGQSITHVTGRRMDFIVIAVLSAGLILFAGDKWWPRGPMELSIAVLPFKNMSADPDREYFADGISEETLNLLAHIPSLKVAARTSAFSFKNMNVGIPTIASQLNTRYVVEGSVRTDGDRVRITAQLIDSKDGMHVWSQTYERDLSAEDLFYIQSDVARAITDKLRVTLTAEDEQRLAKVPTENTEAYEAYLLGRHWLADRKVDELGKAAAQFAKAIELDPNFAGAYSGLADACFLYVEYSGGHAHEDCPPWDPAGKLSSRAVVAPLARKAVELDPELGEAWVSLGNALDGEADSLADKGSRSEMLAKVREAHAAYERGLSLNPSYTQAYLWYANSLAGAGYDNWEDWLEAWKAGTWQSVVKRGLEVDPLSITLHHRLSEPPMWARTKEEALHHARRIVEIAPDSPRGYVRLGELSWTELGRIDESIRWTSKAAEIDPRQPTYAMSIAYGYATLGDIDMAMAYWQRAERIFADDVSPDKHHVLRALILLSGKVGIPMQQVLDALKPLDVGSTDRMEIEASLAIIRGEARDWLASHTEYLSDCLESEIDEAYADNWRDCGVWLDGLLLAAGEVERARAAAKKRMELDSIWWEFTGGPIPWPHESTILGEEDEALEILEKYLTNFRGNPHTFRLYLFEDLRFMLYHDPILEPLRDDARFRAVVVKVEADLAEQLDNVRELERKGELPTLEALRAEFSTE